MIKYVMAWAIDAEILIHVHYLKRIKTQLFLVGFDFCLIESNEVDKLIYLNISQLRILLLNIIEPLVESLINPVYIWELILLNSSLNFIYFISSKHLFDLVKL